jgi:hypothetical protein
MREGETYLCRGRLDGREFIFLWESEPESSPPIVGDGAGKIVAFESESAAWRQASSEARTLATETPHLYDFDAVREWCASENGSVDCGTILDIWNIFTDMPHESALFDEADTRANAVYEKLVLGCNLPAIASSKDRYVPNWSSTEIILLKHLLMLGINEFRSRLSLRPVIPHRG